jgi:large subunit ribosomal protein L24
VQTTLLGLAIAVILALVTALVGPFLIDWGRFRPVIEAEASRLLGAPVRVTGPIEGALLPTPSLTLHGIEIGAPDDRRLRARVLSVEFSLGPLIRGEVRAAEMHLVGPEVNLGINSAGRLTMPKLAASFDPDALSIDHLNIEDGHAVLSDNRSGSRVVLDKLRFDGDLRSLAGPFKGDGAFVIAGEPYAYRVAAGRAGDNGAVKLRLNVDPSNRPFAIDADGALSFDGGEPRFEGSFNIARLAGIALASGQTVTNDPWRLGTRIKAAATSALLEQVEFQYGPEERAVKLTGTAELKFGNKPRFDGVLSARQVDLDRAMPSSEATRRLPLTAIKLLGDAFSGALGPSIPARIGISVDALTLAGATLQAVRGDLATEGEAWNLDGFEFRAPGLTQVNLSGRLDLAAKRLGFVGPVSIDSRDPSALVAWLEGGADASAAAMKPLRARGELTLGSEKFAIDRLRAEIDRKSVEGRLAYTWSVEGQPPRLEAELNAAELDLDALMSFADAARGATTFEMPREVTLGIDIDRATIAGIEARQVSARLRRDGNGLQVERFSVADLGGTSFDARGQIETASLAPRGRMNLTLDARNLDGVVALAAKFAPDAAEPLRRMAPSLSPAKLSATLSLEGAGAGTTAKLAIEGRSGAMRLSLLGDVSRDSAEVAKGELAALMSADVRLQGKLDADDGDALFALLNLDKILAVDKRPGQLTLAANGPLGGEFQVDSRLVAGGFDASAAGTMRFTGEGPKGNLRVAVAAADLQPLRQGPVSRTAEPLPATLTGNLTIAGSSLALDDFSGAFAGTGLRGRLGVVLAQPLRVEGRIEADALDASAAIAAAIGMANSGRGRADVSAWSQEPFAQGLFADAAGRIEFTTTQAAFTPALVLRQARGVAKFSRSEIAFTDLEGSLADGGLTGELVFNKSGAGTSVRAHFRLAESDAGALLGGETPAVRGRLAAQLDIEGTGLSPAALVGSLAGNGTISLEGGQFASLDPKIFDVVARAVDGGLTPDTAKVSEIADAALKSGSLVVSSAEGVITISAGQVRLANTIAQAEGAGLILAANVDLTEKSLNARLTLSGHRGTAASLEVPVVFVSLKGPMTEPKRTVDLSALAAWLTLRSIEQQSKRLEALESQSRESGAGEAALPAVPGGQGSGSPSASIGSDAVNTPEGQRLRDEPLKSNAAPALPPPITVRPAPGSAAGHSAPQPARPPVQPRVGAAVTRKPAPPKPMVPALPLARRPPLDLSPNAQN